MSLKSDKHSEQILQHVIKLLHYTSGRWHFPSFNVAVNETIKKNPIYLRVIHMPFFLYIKKKGGGGGGMSYCHKFIKEHKIQGNN